MMTPGESRVLAHAANCAGWALALATPVAVYMLGRPGYLGFVLAMPFFAVSLWMYNAAAPRPASHTE